MYDSLSNKYNFYLFPLFGEGGRRAHPAVLKGYYYYSVVPKSLCLEVGIKVAARLP